MSILQVKNDNVEEKYDRTFPKHLISLCLRIDSSESTHGVVEKQRMIHWRTPRTELNSCELRLFSSASSRESRAYTNSPLCNGIAPSCRLIRMYKVSPSLIIYFIHFIDLFILFSMANSLYFSLMRLISLECSLHYGSVSPLLFISSSAASAQQRKRV